MKKLSPAEAEPWTIAFAVALIGKSIAHPNAAPEAIAASAAAIADAALAELTKRGAKP